MGGKDFWFALCAVGGRPLDLAGRLTVERDFLGAGRRRAGGGVVQRRVVEVDVVVVVVVVVSVGVVRLAAAEVHVETVLAGVQLVVRVRARLAGQTFGRRCANVKENGDHSLTSC